MLTPTVDQERGPELSLDDPGQVTAEKIVAAVKQIVTLVHPVRVVAFGSRARGNHRHNSDLDLAVIVDKFDPARDKRPLWRADLDVWMDMDVVVYDLERERFMSDSIVSLQSQVKEEGITLYDRETGNIDCESAARLV